MVEVNLKPAAERVVGKVRRRERITAADALVLWEWAPLPVLGMLASELKREKSGENVFYNRNFHIEPTNICSFNCRFCSYHKQAGNPDAWNLTIEEMAQAVDAYKGKPVTEVHVVGGVHPDHTLEDYIEIMRMTARKLPGVTIKAFSAVELVHTINKAGLSFSQGLTKLKEAGLGSIPGGGAEIFDPEVRKRICPEKATAQEWLDLHREAHKLGITTNATMLYGHVEGAAHRIDHLERLRELQDETGGFNAFIPLKFRSAGNPMSSLGEVGITEDMRVLALSRIYLDNFPHIKAYWPMYGKTATEIALSYGADDIDGTIDDTTKIYSMAGAEDTNPAMGVAELEKIILSAGFRPVERDTFYNPVKKR